MGTPWPRRPVPSPSQPMPCFAWPTRGRASGPGAGWRLCSRGICWNLSHFGGRTGRGRWLQTWVYSGKSIYKWMRTGSMAIPRTNWLEVLTIYKAYVKGYPHKTWPYMVWYLHVRILKFPLNLVENCYKLGEMRGGYPIKLRYKQHFWVLAIIGYLIEDYRKKLKLQPLGWQDFGNMEI